MEELRWIHLGERRAGVPSPHAETVSARLQAAYEAVKAGKKTKPEVQRP